MLFWKNVKPETIEYMKNLADMCFYISGNPHNFITPTALISPPRHALEPKQVTNATAEQVETPAAQEEGEIQDSRVHKSVGEQHCRFIYDFSTWGNLY